MYFLGAFRPSILRFDCVRCILIPVVHAMIQFQSHEVLFNSGLEFLGLSFSFLLHLLGIMSYHICILVVLYIAAYIFADAVLCRRYPPCVPKKLIAVRFFARLSAYPTLPAIIIFATILDFYDNYATVYCTRNLAFFDPSCPIWHFSQISLLPRLPSHLFLGDQGGLRLEDWLGEGDVYAIVAVVHISHA